jgi:hypothetical protein
MNNKYYNHPLIGFEAPTVTLLSANNDASGSMLTPVIPMDEEAQQPLALYQNGQKVDYIETNSRSGGLRVKGEYQYATDLTTLDGKPFTFSTCLQLLPSMMDLIVQACNRSTAGSTFLYQCRTFGSDVTVIHDWVTGAMAPNPYPQFAASGSTALIPSAYDSMLDIRDITIHLRDDLEYSEITAIQVIGTDGMNTNTSRTIEQILGVERELNQLEVGVLKLVIGFNDMECEKYLRTLTTELGGIYVSAGQMTVAKFREVAKLISKSAIQQSGLAGSTKTVIINQADTSLQL